VDIDGAVDMASTLAVGGVLTANAGVVVDNFTLDGTTLALSSGNFTLDVALDIIFDAGGGDILFKAGGTEFFGFKSNGTMSSAGAFTLDVNGDIAFDSNNGVIDFKGPSATTFGRIENSSSDFKIESRVQDKDILFVGNDGGVGITALTLDMSDAGTATFNHDIIAASANGVGDLILGGHIRLKTLNDAANEWLVYNYNDDDLHFHFTGSGNSDIVMHNDGDLQILDGNLVVASGHGIDFSATANGGITTPSELLDDYEEGTWQPIFADLNNNAITNLLNQTGTYTKVGRKVIATGTCRTQSSSSTSGVSGNFHIIGLPFTVHSGHAVFHTHPAPSGYNAPLQLPRSSPAIYNTTTIEVMKYAGSGGRTVNMQISDLNMSGNSNFLFFTVVYQVLG